MITKVLVAYDGSECANRALNFGLDLSEKCGASVHILNVFQMPVYGSPDDPLAASASTAAYAKDLRKVHEEALAKAAKTAAALKPAVKVTTELRDGSPPAQIVAAASEGKFDLIVLGHGGEGRLREFFLGGTSERVAHLARCAVLIVK
ncbi:MAG: universal stress protein [Candidatus Bathyarchaeia archaeon]